MLQKRTMVRQIHPQEWFLYSAYAIVDDGDVGGGPGGAGTAATPVPPGSATVVRDGWGC